MKKQNMIIFLIVSLVIVGIASAHCDATLTIPDSDKTVLVGSTVNFTLNLMPDSNGVGSFVWTAESPLTAKIDPKAFSSTGGVQFNTNNGVAYTRTLTVMANSGVVIGQKYNITVIYCETGVPACKEKTIKATAVGTVIPTPELSTSFLSAVGLIGLISLVKFTKKN